RRLGRRLGAADRTRTHGPRSDRNCATGCRQPRVLARPAARPARTGGATQHCPQRGRLGPATAPAGQPRRYRLQECAGMNVETARAEVFGDSLACEEVRPAAFVPGTLSPDAARAACLRGENLLRSLAVVEDSRGDDGEDHSANDLALHRIEAKLDLLTALVTSRFGEHFDPRRPLRWSARGACLEVDDAIAPGTGGAL